MLAEAPRSAESRHPVVSTPRRRFLAPRPEIRRVESRINNQIGHLAHNVRTGNDAQARAWQALLSRAIARLVETWRWFDARRGACWP
jgi:plasmid stabilization system protein ParE